MRKRNKEISQAQAYAKVAQERAFVLMEGVLQRGNKAYGPDPYDERGFRLFYLAFEDQVEFAEDWVKSLREDFEALKGLIAPSDRPIKETSVSEH